MFICSSNFPSRSCCAGCVTGNRFSRCPKTCGDCLPAQAVQLSDNKNLLHITFVFVVHHISFLGSGVEFFVAKFQASFEEAGVRVSEEAIHHFFGYFLGLVVGVSLNKTSI